MTIQVPTICHTNRVILLNKLQSMLAKVDAVPFTVHLKLIFRVGVCRCMSWDLMVNDLSPIWISSKLEATTDFFKKWVGLGRSVDPSRLYLHKKGGGLGLPSILINHVPEAESLIVLPASYISRSCHPPHSLHADQEGVRSDQNTTQTNVYS